MQIEEIEEVEERQAELKFRNMELITNTKRGRSNADD